MGMHHHFGHSSYNMEKSNQIYQDIFILDIITKTFKKRSESQVERSLVAWPRGFWHRCPTAQCVFLCCINMDQLSEASKTAFDSFLCKQLFLSRLLQVTPIIIWISNFYDLKMIYRPGWSTESMDIIGMFNKGKIVSMLGKVWKNINFLHRCKICHFDWSLYEENTHICIISPINFKLFCWISQGDRGHRQFSNKFEVEKLTRKKSGGSSKGQTNMGTSSIAVGRPPVK